MKLLLNKKRWLIFLACIITLIILTVSISLTEILIIDTKGYNLVSNYLIKDKITPFIKIMTNLGGAFFLIILTILSFIFIKNKKISLSILFNLCLITIFNQSLKHLLHRPRPTDNHLINETGYSFPSGHSMVSMAFYGYLIYLVYKYIKNRLLKTVLISILSILIILIGLSRIYLGVHYTSDVLAGFLVSISYLIIYTKIISKYIEE